MFMAKLAVMAIFGSSMLMAADAPAKCAAGKCGVGKCGAAASAKERESFSKEIAQAGKDEVSGSFAFEKSGPLGRGGELAYMSKKGLVVGNNAMVIEVKDKAGNPINNAKVEMKVFMPEMPGMPYMEYVDGAKFITDGKYFTIMNFSMAGTWQVRVYVTTEDGKKMMHKSSVIL